MSGIDLLIGVHNHQPVGNFGHVFEESFDFCYKPQIDVLKDHPGVKMALHFSGPLLEWIEDNRPEFLDDLGALADRGQVEFLSGGFYEPILSSLPVDDAIGQIIMMNEYIMNRFGQIPNGMWTAERIWDTELPSLAAAAGINYTLLDDTHFFYAGLAAKDMFGYWVTEKHGNTLAIFPIDKNLRYSIPFRMPHENIDYLKTLASGEGVSCVTYGDDGEKFGVWPETYKWVYEERWLHNFYGALEESKDIVRTTLFSEYLANNSSNGRVYLPLASYEEMMEWSLPPESGVRFHQVLADIDAMGKREEWRPFIRGGLWNNFLSKYDESNRMHKKMISVSRKLSDANGIILANLHEDATMDLYRGQCNCAYWHGLFGGLYLNYLRHGVYSSLIQAETIIDNARQDVAVWVSLELFDYDADGVDELLIANPLISIVIDPDYGGSLAEFDYRPAAFCLTNTLTRRPEAYHKIILEHENNQDENSGAKNPASIHDIVRMKEEGLSDHLNYDKCHRRVFQDHFISSDVTLDNFARSDFIELGDFLDSEYETTDIENYELEATVTLKREGMVIIDGAACPVAVEKQYLINGEDATLTVTYNVTNMGDGKIECRFGVELNLTLLAGDAEDRYWTGEGIIGTPNLLDMGEIKSAKSIGMRDDWAKFEVIVSSDIPVDIWRHPVETVSQSESGFERIYQGSSVVLLSHISLLPGDTMKCAVTLEVKDKE